jgi:hypothetical protein
MRSSLASVRSSVGRFKVEAQCVALATLAFAVFVALGLAARERVKPSRAQVGSLRQDLADLEQFRAAFRRSASDADAQTALLPDSLAVAVQPELRTTLAHAVASRGELDGLSEVRVKFAPADSGAPSSTPILAGKLVKVADYTMSVDCDGSFSALLSLVNHLPPSVSLRRLAAVRGPASTHFHLTLAVFQPSGSNQHG